MPKLFTKKQIFPFLASFFITLVIGFFIWNIFISLDNGVLNKIGFKIFPASVSSNYATENLAPVTDSEQEDSNNQDLELDENLLVIQNPIVVAPESLQDQLDDIQEKLDIISQQVRELIAQQNQDDKLVEADEDKILDEEPDDENDQDDEQNENIVTYPKILISEIQISGTSDDKQEFVELYNPNNQDIDLTDWYLQRRTAGSSSWSTYASNNLFSGKIISANGYLLIARTGYYLGLADIFTDNPITNDNSFALKNPNSDISDKLGFGNAVDPELFSASNSGNGQSIGRKILNGTEQDTDNNSADFEIDSPTPKAQNITYTALISGDGGGGDIVYLKVLISEVQISPIDQRFVELYNPNTTAVNLTGWYLQRKTKSATPGDSWNSFVSSTKFAGKSIPANGYFLISKQLSGSDILLDLTLSSDNSLALKNPNREISDKLGFGDTQDFETAPAQNSIDSQSLGRIFDKISQNYTDTDDNSTDFELQTPTPKAQNIKWVEPPSPTDITPPEVNFNLIPIQNALDFTVNFTITDLAEIVTPSGLESYIFQWQEEGGDWQTDPSIDVSENPLSIDLTRNFIGEDEKTYNFQVQAKDVAGNISDWLPLIPATTSVAIPIPTKAILINEIQIAGQTVKDEFIELYNPNDFDIDLSGFSLKKKTSSGTESNLVSSSSFIGIITALGYFLVVPQPNDDGTLNYTGLITPDLYYSGKSYSIASNNTILFYDKDDNL